MEKYFTPAGPGGAEITEKRSRFIARVIPAGNEDEAKAEIGRARAQYHDARHCCWCYIIRGGAERYSDDGEPQGTAGLPMLEVFRHNEIMDVCCTVTRYFGGILLGPGGLSRAYSGAAKLALEAAGAAEIRNWERIEFTCGYNILGKVNSEIVCFGGIVESADYGEGVAFRALLPPGSAESFNKSLAEASAGKVSGIITGSAWRAINNA